MPLCKDGYWREYQTYEGKRVFSTGKTQEEALVKLGEKLSEVKKGTLILDRNTKVKTWANNWLETYKKASGMTSKSYSTYDDMVNKFIIPAIGHMRLADVKESHLQKILNEQAGKSFSHASKLRMIMRQMFHRAVRERLLNYDPAEDLKLPEVTEGKRRSLTKYERAEILKLAETHPSGLWVKMLLGTGIRPGESIALRWKDIDFDEKTVTISQALESGTTDTFKPPKTEAGNRTIPLPDYLFASLEAARGEPFSFIFTQQLKANKDKHHTESSLNSYWKSFIRALDIQMGAEVYRNQIIVSKVATDLTPYVLRHTFCTDLQEAGVPLNIAKVLMGHDDITVTANIYTHHTEEMMKQARRKMNTLEKSNKKKSETPSVTTPVTKTS